jgi:hypothetical protein
MISPVGLTEKIDALLWSLVSIRRALWFAAPCTISPTSVAVAFTICNVELGVLVPIPIYPVGSIVNLLVLELKSYMSSVPVETTPTLMSYLLLPTVPPNVLAKESVVVVLPVTWRVDDGAGVPMPTCAVEVLSLTIVSVPLQPDSGTPAEVIYPESLEKNPTFEGKLKFTVPPDEVTFQSPDPVEVVKVNAGPVAVPPPAKIVLVAGAAVRTATPFWVIVPDALNAPSCKSWVPLIVSVDVPLSPPSVVTQNGKLFVVIADEVDTLPLPPLVEVEYLLPLISKRVAIVALGVRNSVDDTSPKAITFPELDIENLVELFTWKFTKSPLYPAPGLAPKNVPDALPPVIKLLPRRKRVEVEVSGDMPATERRDHGEVVSIPTLPFESMIIRVELGLTALPDVVEAAVVLKMMLPPTPVPLPCPPKIVKLLPTASSPLRVAAPIAAWIWLLVFPLPRTNVFSTELTGENTTSVLPPTDVVHKRGILINWNPVPTIPTIGFPPTDPPNPLVPARNNPISLATEKA